MPVQEPQQSEVVVAEEEVKFTPEMAKAKFEETGEVLGPDGNKIEGLALDTINTTTKLFCVVIRKKSKLFQLMHYLQILIHVSKF